MKKLPQFSIPLLIAVVLTSLGCQQDQITTYQAPSDAVPGLRDNLIVAGIFFRDDKNAWFFKLSGPSDKVRDQSAAFESVVRSVQFADEEPQWTMPEGWERLPGNPPRYATLKSKAHPELDGSVTQLPLQDESPVAYLQHNIARWCDQVGMPTPDDVRKCAKVITTATGEHAVWVDLSGVEPDALIETGIAYETPPGWNAAQPNEIRRALFLVEDGEQQVEISVSVLAASSNPLLANVNRWRTQVGLPDIDAEQLKSDSKQIEIGGEPATYVELVGAGKDGAPAETVLGAIQYRGSEAWFYKLKGSGALAEREKPHFESFLRSLTFTEKKAP